MREILYFGDDVVVEIERIYVGIWLQIVNILEPIVLKLKCIVELRGVISILVFYCRSAGSSQSCRSDRLPP
jgi:NADPH-dependent 7-cyano-7-deazaguanine reductase QueF